MSDQDLHVIDHHLDAENNVYRLLIGTPVEHQREKVDEEGNPVMGRSPLLGPGGEVMKDVDGKEIYLPGGPEFETVTEYVPGLDFVFAADDERWQGKSPEQIAAEQREEVKNQLAEQAANAERAGEQRQQLPGSGEAL